MAVEQARITKLELMLSCFLGRISNMLPEDPCQNNISNRELRVLCDSAYYLLIND